MLTQRLRAFVFLLGGCVIVAGRAQSPPVVTPSQAQLDICHKYQTTPERCAALVQEFAVRQDAKAGNNPQSLDPFEDLDLFVSERAQAAFAAVSLDQLKEQAELLALQAISTRGAVNQVGAAPTSGSGSTNLVAKPTTTDFLAIASESGAFTDTVNGTSATIQANANGLAKLFTNHPIFSLQQPRWSPALQPLSFTASLNIAQSGGSTAVPTSGSSNTNGVNVASVLLPTNNATLSSFQVRYAVYRPADPTSPELQKAVSAALEKNQPSLDQSGEALADVVDQVRIPIETSPAFAEDTAIWIRLAKAAEEQLATDPLGAFDKLVSAYMAYTRDVDGLLQKTPAYQQNILAMSTALHGVQNTAENVMSEARGTPLVTIAYTYATPPQQPATHQFSLVGGYLFKGGHTTPGNGGHDGQRTFTTGAQFTVNFAASLYAGNTPAGMGSRLRDLQSSAEFDKPFGGTSDNPRATWSVAGYGQYQYDPAVLNITAGNLVPGTNITLPGNAQVLLGTAGWLGVLQGKVQIHLNRGLSVPIALKWSNRTTLLDATNIRGQFGLLYDLSALSRLITEH